MIVNFIIIALIAVYTDNNFASAIHCDFKYVEHNSLGSSQKATKTSSSPNRVIGRNVPVKVTHTIFECEDPNDDYEEITEVKPMEFDSRFGEDEYEPADSNECPSNKRTIQPKALNNIYNELLDVLNTATVVQSIEIDECGTKNAECNNGNAPPKGKKTLCRQKYVKITLKAYDKQRKIVNEPFYYPSHCICELVQRKRSV